MPIANIGKIQLYYEREGSGPPVLFITGLSGGHEHWTPIIAYLKTEYECITFDNRGIGRSSKPENDYAITTLVQDTLGLLKDLNIIRAHIVGLSLGGMIGQIIATQHPELVDRLVLIASMAKPSALMNHIQESRKLLKNRLTPYEYSWVVASWMFGSNSIGKPNFVENYAKKAASNPAPQIPQAFIQLADAISQFDSRPLLGKIGQPTLVIVGEEDSLIPPYQSRILAKGIPNADLAVLPGLGHLCTAENPQKVAEQLSNFFGRSRHMDTS